MRWIALLLVACVSGCANPQASTQADAPAQVALSVIGAPRMIADAQGTALVWTLDARANGSAPVPARATIAITVHYQRTRDAGSDQADVEVPGQATLRTRYIGFGDYTYDITARDAAGRPVGETRGMWERCPC